MYPDKVQEYHSPTSIDEAAKLGAQYAGQASFIAGGMSLMQAMKSRIVSPGILIDLNRVEALKGVSSSDERVVIGSMARYRSIVENSFKLAGFEAVVDAARHVGDRQVRNRGTIGGSLSWNYVNSCTPTAILACGAKINITRAAGGVSSIAIDDFLQGPMTTELNEGDLVTAIEFSKPSKPSGITNVFSKKNRIGSAYKKWGVVKDALPVIGFAAFFELHPSEDKIIGARIAVGGLPNGATRAPRTEETLVGSSVGSENDNLIAAASLASEELTTESDPWISAKYKSQLIRDLGTQVMRSAFERARGANQ